MSEREDASVMPGVPIHRGSGLREQPWPVAVFAHNEETRIVACLESIYRSSPTHAVEAYVLVNGCTDRTEAVVRGFAYSHPWVKPISLPLGDKSNSWNHFVHRIAPAAPICFFVDGDVRAEPGSFDALSQALQRFPEANAAAAVPSTGRSRKALEALVCEHRLLMGNLYALRGDFLRRARQLGARLPIGYIGDDSLVDSLAKWDLDPTGPFLGERVVPCPAARFQFDSLSPWRYLDWRLYWRRRVRYSLRHFQHELLTPLLKSGGLGGLPGTVAELYERQSAKLRDCRRRRGIDAIFDRIAIAQMHRQLEQRNADRAFAGADN